MPSGHGLIRRKCGCDVPASGAAACGPCDAKEGLQPKLAVGPAHDPLEREADRVADRILAMPPTGGVGRGPVMIQRAAAASLEADAFVPESVPRVLGGPGKPLDTAVRQDMEQRFGHDFSQVRAHHGADAARSARDIGARAYTVGSDIVFGEAFAPATLAGRHLLAHELVHVVQQASGARLQRQASHGGGPGAGLSAATTYGPGSTPQIGGKAEEATPALEIVHAALDIAGFFPGLGAIPDGVNALIYAVEGDWTNAGLSAVAMIPLYGDGIHLVTMGTKTALKVTDKAAAKLGKEGLAKAFTETKAISKTGKQGAKTAQKEAAVSAKASEKGAASAVEKTEKEIAENLTEKEIKKKISTCEALYEIYKRIVCRACKWPDTPSERALKIACFTGLIADRIAYLAERCDYFLPASRKKGSTEAEKSHWGEVNNFRRALENCKKMPIKG